MAKHKHYDCIVAWAEGKPIQCRLDMHRGWSDIKNQAPCWANALE